MRVVTIDGPAGAGKSSVAGRVAERLGWRLLDTGAMYRAATLAAIRAGVELESDHALGELAQRIAVRLNENRVFLDDEDVTGLIRSVEVTRVSRHLADSPRVRARLVEWQRDFAREHDVIAEGRDQGTIVFPEAFLKVFLTASLEERARRRFAEFQARGELITYERVRDDLSQRDLHDERRAIAPMAPARDAIVVDSTGQTLDQVVSAIERLAGERLRAERLPRAMSV